MCLLIAVGNCLMMHGEWFECLLKGIGNKNFYWLFLSNGPSDYENIIISFPSILVLFPSQAF